MQGSRFFVGGLGLGLKAEGEGTRNFWVQGQGARNFRGLGFQAQGRWCKVQGSRFQGLGPKAEG